MTPTLDGLLGGEVVPGLFSWQGDRWADIEAAGRTRGWVVRELETSDVLDTEDLYDRIAESWQLPDWFGRNLDAWWDVLGDLVESPQGSIGVLVVWRGYAQLADVDPELAQTVLELLRDASTQARALAVVVVAAPALIELDALR